VLGIEAASNGAGRVVLVEQQRDTARSLQQSLQQLSLENQCELVNSNALDYLQRCGESFDVIFVDPPFNRPDLLKKAVTSICEQKLLRGALYVEYQQGHQALIDETLIANGLTVSKTAKAGTTRCVLARRV
jgi:16S rRNA (guanine966-N2)-methyltransferase